MPKFEFCIPTVGKAVPAGAEWFHEVKYDGYRLRVERDGDRVRLITRGGHDWFKRFPWIAEAALRNRRKQFVIDGEAVILGVDGIADFNALHSGRQNAEVQFCAFDVLSVDGEDVRDLPLSMRKSNLERLLRGRPDGIFVNPFEIGAVGPDLFRAACNMGLEGLVSKRISRREITALDQGQEPDAPGNDAGCRGEEVCPLIASFERNLPAISSLLASLHAITSNATPRTDTRRWSRPGAKFSPITSNSR
jgi:bifunctional non-homologous end joining protein LigD